MSVSLKLGVKMIITGLLSVLSILWISNPALANAGYNITIDGSKQISNLTHFWESTGFCPPAPHQQSAWWFLGPDMDQNLRYIGAVAFSGIKQVRMHWLLDLISVLTIRNEQVEYNCTVLDKVLDKMLLNGLKPGFELMGNPSNIFTNLDNKTQVYMWKDLVYQIATRYIRRYGIEYVEKWNFETWNEPGNLDFDKLNISIQGFLNYWDACAEGLWTANPRLRLGGPSGDCSKTHRSVYCWVFLNHIVRGVNFFTGKIGSRIDYIVVHQKGIETNNTDTLMAWEELMFNLIQTREPSLSSVDRVNDEADPLGGWDTPRWWRADTTYAAMVVKIIAKHQYKYLTSQPITLFYKLLGNDNGFLTYNPNFFTQRTLVARFQMNNTVPHHVQMIRKPVYSVMGLLALLGETHIKSYIYKDSKHVQSDGDLGVLATVHHALKSMTSDSWQATVLVYYSRDTENETGSVEVDLKLNGLNPKPSVADILYVQYNLNNRQGNPSRIWESLGKPATPTMIQFAEMRKHDYPVRVETPKPFGRQSLRLSIPLPGVTVIHMCCKPSMAPEKLGQPIVEHVTDGQVLITWNSDNLNTKCLLTYIVEYSKTGTSGTYVRINDDDTIFTVFHYAPLKWQKNDINFVSLVRGYYRVQAVDYWGREGQFSHPKKY